MLRSLRLVADALGETPGIEDYKRVRRQLEAEGHELEPVSRVLKHFNGSWHLVREAVGLAEVTIQASALAALFLGEIRRAIRQRKNPGKAHSWL